MGENFNKSLSKIDRIKSSNNYARFFIYHSTSENIISITHSGLTSIGFETLIETITYLDVTTNGSNVTSIIFS